MVVEFTFLNRSRALEWGVGFGVSGVGLSREPVAFGALNPKPCKGQGTQQLGRACVVGLGLFFFVLRVVGLDEIRNA